jgi:hypothetical protein
VTGIVRGTDGRWYAIDPIMGGVREINEWMRGVRARWDKPHLARFYIARPSAILPDVRVFPPPDKETGDRIIEIRFDPRLKPGFSPAGPGFAVGADLKDDVFELDPSAPSYFLDALAGGDSQFDFESIAINGHGISYNGYFRDLITGLIDPKPLVKAATPRPEALSRDIGLGSLSFRRDGSVLQSPETVP